MENKRVIPVGYLESQALLILCSASAEGGIVAERMDGWMDGWIGYPMCQGEKVVWMGNERTGG